MDQEKLGKFIEKLRKDKNWTQKDLGEKLGVSNGAVSKWECGNNLPDISMLEPLSKALDISVMNLLNCQEPSEEERELEKQNNIRKICFRNLKYLTCILCLILLISLCCLPLVINSVRNLSKKNKTEDDTVRVFEFVSDNHDNIFIQGYIIFNENETIINMVNMKYHNIERGTTNETYAENIKVILEIDDKEIYKFITNENFNEPRRVGEIINNILTEKEDEIIINNNLFEIETDFSNSVMRIECYENDNVVESYKINLKLNEKFS